MPKFIVSLVLSVLLTACGLKGPLYLPQGKPTTSQPATPAPAMDAPADDRKKAAPAANSP